MAVIEKLVLSGIRHSWRLQQALTVSVSRDDLTIPVMHGFGLGHLGARPKEEWFTPILRDVARTRGGAFVDVGAHVGAFMLMWLEAAGRDRPYFAFEPHTACCHYLERLIATNRLDAHYAFPLALSERQGVLTLVSNSEKDVRATTLPEFHNLRYGHRKHVRSEIGDVIMAALGAPDVAVLKVDVEGAELEVLRGFEQTLNRCRPVLHLEVSPYADLIDARDENTQATGRFRQARVAQLEELLRSHGYRFQRIEYGSALVDVDTLHAPAGVDFSDYWCTPDR